MPEVQVMKKGDLDAVLADIQTRIEANKPDVKGFATLEDIRNELRNELKAIKVEAKVDEKPVQAALEEAGVLTNIAKTEFMGVGVGKIAIGTFGGIFIGELVDGFLASQQTVVKGGVKLALGGVVAGWGKRWVGKDAAMAVAFVLGVLGLSQVLPVDKWAQNAARSVRGILPGTLSVTGNPVMNQANRVVDDYYKTAFGR